MTDARRRELVAKLAGLEREFDRKLEEIRTLVYQRHFRDAPPVRVGDRLDRASDRAQALVFEIDDVKRELRGQDP